jgi:hypothetical protein
MPTFLFHPVPHEHADSVSYRWRWHKTDPGREDEISGDAFEYLKDCVVDASRHGFDARCLPPGETLSMLIKPWPRESIA